MGLMFSRPPSGPADAPVSFQELQRAHREPQVVPPADLLQFPHDLGGTFARLRQFRRANRHHAQAQAHGAAVHHDHPVTELLRRQPRTAHRPGQLPADVHGNHLIRAPERLAEHGSELRRTGLRRAGQFLPGLDALNQFGGIEFQAVPVHFPVEQNIKRNNRDVVLSGNFRTQITGGVRDDGDGH